MQNHGIFSLVHVVSSHQDRKMSRNTSVLLILWATTNHLEIRRGLQLIQQYLRGKIVDEKAESISSSRFCRTSPKSIVI